ncbi:glycosyltransferase involved in cell wall biosynthesis [Caulobacter ginsengisoli]|uniref:Glycosyltransferase involved in cell wall biosynthesis n=1 Tax=Caulobacter ginsengisoli TaxID=400775 RepID=A0ABU0IM79_9CAUL|nr:glycosyltransferase family 4 protein [Caulobacter ginsengisoli]MDQ0463119.1 glycosyltransferase involved in cell wall biosynthesis [Caulobacter ginsengisoli]
MKPRLGILLTHPVQYYSPWFRALAQASDLTVYYAHQQSAEGQAQAGFGTAFEWDVPLLDGYDWHWLTNVSRRPGLSHFNGCDTPEIAQIVRTGHFDAFIIFGWNKKSFIQAGWACHRSGTPCFIRLDSQLAMQASPLKRAIKRLVYSAILPWAAHYLTPGVRSDAYLRHFGVPERRIHRLPHMIDVDRFSASAQAARVSGETAALRARHGAGDDDFVLLFAGKLLARKRPGLVLEALRWLRTSDPKAAARLKVWLVGDGPLRGELEAFTAQHALPVSFLGFVNQSAIPTAYAAADCLVLPSNGEETWGLVVNESFACGRPAIVSIEAGCAPDLIEDGVTGWTLRHPDADALAKVMATALRDARRLPNQGLAAKNLAGSYSTGVASLLETLSTLKANP